MNGAIRPDPPLPASPIDGVVRALGWALLAGIALYAAHAVGLLAGGTTFFAAYLHTGLFVAAAAICLVRAGVSPHDRAAWTLVGAGIACWAAGNAAWDIAVAGGPSPASPSPADVYWLLFYLAAYPALFLLVRARIGGIHASAWMDGLLAALSTAALLAAFVVVPLADHTGGTRHEVATTLAYPVLDAVLVIECVVAATLAGRRAGRGLWAAAAALALFTAADAIFAYTVAAGTYDGDGLINIVWPVGMAIIALIAWRTRAQRPVVVASAPALTMSVLLIPFTFAAAAAALLAYGNVAGLSPLAVWLAAAAVAVGLARTALGFREVVGAAETRRQAMTDELTGLANRRHLERELDRAVHAAEATGGRVVFLLIDLDGFKEVNDTLGHKAGDALLRRIGPRLRGAIGPGHLLARLGGDEFGILMPGASDPAATGMAQEVRLRLQEAFALEGLSIAIDASVGIAAYPEEAASPDELIQHADVAMYQAKGTRTGVQRYEARRNPHSRDRLALLGGLRAALVRGEVVPHYQPQADAVTGEVVAMEALARWHHPERGVLTPAVFLPHAEQSALMRPLTLAMLERALADVVAWRAAGAEVGVAVNLSVVNLIDERLPGDVRRCLSAAGARPEWLELEITENVVMTDPARACEVLGELRDVGVSVALDDYGTGQASLAWLKRLPVDVLKIDRSFVKDVASDLQSAAIVRSAVDLARAFGLRTVAEGVEDAACLRRAAELGCDLVQGYAIARPLDGAAAAAFLAAGEAPVAPPPTLGAPAIPLRHAAGPHGHRAHGAG